MHKHHAWAAIAAAIALAAGITVGASVFATSEHAQRIVTEVLVPGSKPVKLDSNQQQSSDARPTGVDSHEDAKDETPPGVTMGMVHKIENSDPLGIGKPRPVGGAQRLSCQYKPVVNQSARASGSKVSMFVLHFTVSAPGSIDSIWGLFNTPSFAASSTYLLEFSGKCYRLMPFDRKPWTQGAFNSVSESVEIIARGTESRAYWLSQPIFTQSLLAEMVLDRLRARGLPLKRVNPSGCNPIAGWTDHDALECGNNHTDVQPNFPYDVLQKQILDLAKGGEVIEWQVRSKGQILYHTTAKTVDGVSGYQRSLKFMADNPSKVRSAESANGFVSIRKVAVA